MGMEMGMDGDGWAWMGMMDGFGLVGLGFGVWAGQHAAWDPQSSRPS